MGHHRPTQQTLPTASLRMDRVVPPIRSASGGRASEVRVGSAAVSRPTGFDHDSDPDAARTEGLVDPVRLGAWMDGG